VIQARRARGLDDKGIALIEQPCSRSIAIRADEGMPRVIMPIDVVVTDLHMRECGRRPTCRDLPEVLADAGHVSINLSAPRAGPKQLTAAR
jgi:hypothetical protein